MPLTPKDFPICPWCPLLVFSDSRPCTASLCYVLFAYFCLVIIHMKGVLVLGIYSYRCYRHIIYVYIYIYTDIHIYIYIYTSQTYIYIYIFIYTVSTHIYNPHVYMCVCVRVRACDLHVCSFICIDGNFVNTALGFYVIHTHTHTQTHTHTYTYIYIYIHR